MGLKPIKDCDEDLKEDFSCFLNSTIQNEPNFCVLNNFDCLVRNPKDFGDMLPQICQNNTEEKWKCYSDELKPLNFTVLVSNGEEFSMINVFYLDSNPSPFSELRFEQESEIIPHCNSSNSMNETYEVKRNGNYSLKIFQPAYEDFEEVILYIEQGHYF